VVLLAIAITAAIVVLQSGWFHEYVRKRIVAELERATGSRVELGSFTFRVETLTARVAPLVLHGKEDPNQAPLLRADSVSLGLRIISVLERKIDLASLIVEKPQVHVVIFPDGSTNLPAPLLSGERSWAEDLIHLAVRRYEIKNGLLEYDDRKIPLAMHGEGLELRMRYDRRTPAYQAELSSRGVRVSSGQLAPIDGGLSAQFTVERSRVRLSRLTLATQQSRADLSGEILDLRRPRGSFDVKARAAVREWATMLKLPLEPAGSAEFNGRVSIDFADKFRFTLNGRMNARGLGYSKDRVKLQGVDSSGDVTASLDQLSLKNLRASALGATFTGSATLDHWSALRVDGMVKDLTVAQAAKFVTDRAMPWNGIAAGDISATTTLGKADTKAQVNLTISPAPGGAPLMGRVNGGYNQATGELSLESLSLATAASRLDAAGTLNKSIQVRFQSTNLDDVLPALAILDPQAPKELPLKLKNGVAEASGTVTGHLDDPQFQGLASVTNAAFEGHVFDKFTATLTASKNAISASRFTLTRGMTEIAGNANIAARNGSFDDAAIGGQATIRNADLHELAQEAGATVQVSGMASATARVAGSVKAPEAEITLDVQKPSAFGEQLDRLRANVRATQSSIDISGGEAEDGPGRLHFSGNYRRSGNDWKSGEAQVQIAAQNLPAKRVDALSRLAPRLDGRLSADVKGQLQIGNGAASLRSADGSVSAQAVTLDGQPLGEASLTGVTNGDVANVSASGKLRDAAFQGKGSWKLEGDEPGSATVTFSRIGIESVHQLAMMAGAAPQTHEELPFQGFVQGHAAISLPLRHPQAFQSEVTLDTVELDPKSNQARRLGVQAGDITIKNSGPVVVALNSREARIVSAMFTARDTSLEAKGTVPFSGGGAADLSLSGSVNLIILQLLNPNLLASGNASVTATLQGALSNPSVNGRLEIKDASLYLNDIPNGVDHANGVLRFDRNRAVIEKLTAQTGGGTATFGGFIEFGQVLTYRLQADAKQVRIRYPEDLSSTFDADLTLTGTSEASTLAGTVTLTRAVLTPTADLARLLSSSQGPAPTGSGPNDYLRGMSLNVQIEGAPNFEFQTSLTRDVEAAVNLRLRGSPSRPLLLGSIDVTEGELKLFGSTYTIDRGEIKFQNPVKIEPTLDMQLETKARGIVVTISLTGTMQKLNINYSSDPPLKQSEIVALLALGRAPSAAGSYGNTVTTSSLGATDLAQALSAQSSSRYERFFGATRVKIDPNLTGIDSLPESRLTWEQPISKDVTFTYITNLNYTQEQIVRVEWDFEKHWSAVAVRDANGLFGIDFQYRKRLK
jgi:translocation and assembly module TamB